MSFCFECDICGKNLATNIQDLKDLAWCSSKMSVSDIPMEIVCLECCEKDLRFINFDKLI